MNKKLPLPGEIYEHYKGGTYKIICLSVHTETQEKLVIYKSINFGSIFARPLEQFLEDVEIEVSSGSKINVARFRMTHYSPISEI